jgi:hypothetical protein
MRDVLERVLGRRVRLVPLLLWRGTLSRRSQNSRSLLPQGLTTPLVQLEALALLLSFSFLAVVSQHGRVFDISTPDYGTLAALDQLCCCCC